MVGLDEIDQVLTSSLKFFLDFSVKILVGDLYIHLTSEKIGFVPNDADGLLVLLSHFMNIGDCGQIFFQVVEFGVNLTHLGFNFIQTPLELRVF